MADDTGGATVGADVVRLTGATAGFRATGVSGMAGALGAAASCSCSCSCSRMGSSEGGTVVDRRPGVCEAAVAGGGSSAVGDEKSSVGVVSSILDSRLVTLSQLTGRTLVLAWGRGRGIGVVVPSGPSELFCGSWGWKADLSLLKRPLDRLSPEKEPRDVLFSCSRSLRFLSSCSACLLRFSSCFFLSSSSFFRFSSSFFFCLSMSLGVALGRSSWGMNPDGYETICMEWGRRWRGPM